MSGATPNFRATFSADTSGFASQMRQMKEDSKQMASEMISDALAVASATKQNVNKVLEDQIRLYEKRRELLKSEERMGLDSKYSARMASASDANRGGVANQWAAAKSNLADQFKRDDLQIDLLREVIATLKETAANEMVQEADKAADNVRAVKEGKTEGMSPDQIFKAHIQETFNKPPPKEDEKKEDKSMWEVAKGTFLGQMAASALHKLGGVATGVVGSSDGEIAASRLWSTVPYIGDALAEASSRHINLAESRDRAALYIRARGADVNLLGDEDDSARPEIEVDQEVSAARKRNDIKDAVNVRNAASDKVDQIKMMERVTNQPKESSVSGSLGGGSNDNGSSEWKYLEAGVDSVDFINRAGKLINAIGSASGLRGQTKSMIDITQGGGIDEGTTLGMADVIRQKGGGDLRAIMGQVVGELTAGGTTKATRDRNVQDVVSMSQARYNEGFADVDPVKMAKVKAAFQSNYGIPLSNTSNIQGVMNNMAHPKDEFQQGTNYKIYAEQMAKEGKEASYVGFQQWQEKPENGLMSGKMDYLKGVYGTGEYGQMAFHSAGIGSTWEANEMYLKGGTKGLSPEDMAKGAKSTSFDATSQVTTRQQLQAQLTDAYTKGMMSGLKEAFAQVADAIGKQSTVAGELLNFLKVHNGKN